VRPIFAYHNIHNSFVTGGGDVRVYAAQLRYAVNDRLAIIATKDGYIDANLGALGHQSGWADLAAGLKYALIDDKENEFILTPGFRLTLPTGNKKVFQGTGKGEWDVFVSSGKGWGNFHATANAGLRLPNDMNQSTALAHYSAQLDYYSCQYFIPFISLNAMTVLNSAKTIGLPVEGFDLINFGSSGAAGETQVVFGGGFRSRLHEKVDLGFAYEAGVTNPKGIFDNRFTIDLIFRF
jgi:hypothetical protein